MIEGRDRFQVASEIAQISHTDHRDLTQEGFLWEQSQGA